MLSEARQSKRRYTLHTWGLIPGVSKDMGTVVGPARPRAHQRLGQSFRTYLEFYLKMYQSPNET